MDNTVALVTGSSSGIGRCTAEALVRAGCTVYGISRRQIPQEGVVNICADVSDEGAVRAAVALIVEKCGKIDIVVNAAGFGISGATEFTELEDAKRQFDVNFFGMVNVNKAVLPIMRQQGRGRIVNISSVAAVAHIPFQSFYSASKAAMESYTCALSNEVKPFGISVTAIQLGDIRTGFTEARKKTATGDDIYGGRIERSVSGMEKDEQKGMDPQAAGSFIAKTALQKRVKPVCTMGFGYKILSALCKILPCSFRNWIVGYLYAK